jgi:hypothetical protein
MQPTATDFKVEGSLGGEQVGMTFDENSLPHLMSVLTNMYANPLLAVIREYSTNAWDSHVAAGVTRPIEVTTPNYLSSTLKIKDFGLGMNADDIRNTYSKYGSSTKRTTDTQTGMLGIGCKSALTYTGQFNIIGVKDGIKTNVVVSRSESGAGIMEIIDQSVTSEGNGVEIIIPTQSGNKVVQAAYDFFKFWQPGQILLNGEEVATVWETSDKVGPFYMLEAQEDYVVMGNVPYPAGSAISGESSTWRSNKAVALVDIGEINFTPSRESLHMTKLTKTKLDKLRTLFDEEMTKTVQARIDACTTYKAALTEYFELKGRSTYTRYMGNVTYRGNTFIERYDFDWYVDGFHRESPTVSDGDRTYLSNINMNNMIIIHGFTCSKVNGVHKKKIRKFLEDEGYTLRGSVITVNKENPSTVWLSEFARVHWDDIKSIKLESNKPVRKPETFDVLIGYNDRIHNQDVSKTKTVVYGSGAELNSDKEYILKILLDDNVQFILVGKNRWEKFKAKYPKAIYWLDEAKSRVLDYISTKSANDISIMEKDMTEIDIISGLDTSRILDPAIQSVVFDGDSDSQWKAQNRHRLYRTAYYHLGMKDGFPEKSSIVAPKLLEAYPLVNKFGYGIKEVNPEHLIAYMNAIYTLKI